MIEDNSTISFKDVMRYLWSGERADITVVKCDLSHNQGGDFKDYTQVRFNLNREKGKISNRPTANSIAIDERKNIFYSPSQHINIQLLNGKLRKIYKVALVKFNNQIVVM